MRRERPGHTLCPTALVHDYFTKLLGGQWERDALEDFDRFRRRAVRKLAQLLIDHDRGKSNCKHGGGWQRVDVDLTALALRDDLEVQFKLEVEDFLELLAAQPQGARKARA